MAKANVNLHLLKADGQIDEAAVLAMFEAMTGRKATPDEIAALRRELADDKDDPD